MSVARLTKVRGLWQGVFHQYEEGRMDLGSGHKWIWRGEVYKWRNKNQWHVRIGLKHIRTGDQGDQTAWTNCVNLTWWNQWVSYKKHLSEPLAPPQSPTPRFAPHTSKALSGLNCPIHPNSITVKSSVRAHAISSTGLSVVGLGWKLIRASLTLGTEKSIWKRRITSGVEWVGRAWP